MKEERKKNTYSIRDIAKQAGVSIATVSRYLNHPETVSPSTGESIQKVIHELGYVPNALTYGVFRNELQVIGLVVPSVADSYFNYITKLIEKNASLHGYATILCNTDDDFEQERKHIDLLQRLRVSGIIAVRPCYIENYDHLICPVVTYENPIAEDILNIATNDFESGQAAFAHLYSRGARNFLMIKGPARLRGSENRYLGFRQAAEAAGCSLSVCELSTDYHFYMGSHFLDPYLSDGKIDGIFAFSDMIAAVAMDWLQSHGRQVPEDVRVIGFDDSDICVLQRPKLTTFKQPGKEICKQLVDSLIAIINGQTIQANQILLDSELLVRGST